MNKTRSVMAAIALAGLCITPAHAGEADARAWENHIDLGAVRTSGNTSTTTLNGAWNSVLERPLWRVEIAALTNASSSNNTTTAETYEASFQTDRNLDASTWTFVHLGFESDRFAGYRQRFSETAGIGRWLFRSECTEWKAELGGGLRQTRATDHHRIRETILRASTNMEWHVSDTTELSQELNTEGAGRRWTSKSVTALTTRINAHVSSKIALRLTHNSRAPAGKKKLDSELTAGLSFNF